MFKPTPIRIHTKIANNQLCVPKKRFFCSKQLSKVTKTEPFAEGKWLRLIKVHYQDEKNQNRVWEALEGKITKNAEVNAVEIVPILKKKGQDTQIVALKQFRAPAGVYMIELPAGLLDSNEKAIDTALRELKEETGYSGVVINESVPVRFSMAITNITSKIVVVEIDGDKPENQNPKQYLEGEEQAEVIHIPFNNIMNTVNQYKSQGYGVDGKIVMMATGIQLTNDLGKLS